LHDSIALRDLSLLFLYSIFLSCILFVLLLFFILVLFYFNKYFVYHQNFFPTVVSFFVLLYGKRIEYFTPVFVQTIDYQKYHSNILRAFKATY
jgi:hypothetical protein